MYTTDGSYQDNAVTASFATPTSTTLTLLSDCRYGEEVYQNGASWNLNGDPCVRCQCNQGAVLCAATSCFVTCENSVYLDNTCCPICTGMH